jgi:hypothetical protein
VAFGGKRGEGDHPQRGSRGIGSDTPEDFDFGRAVAEESAPGTGRHMAGFVDHDIAMGHHFVNGRGMDGFALLFEVVSGTGDKPALKIKNGHINFKGTLYDPDDSFQIGFAGGYLYHFLGISPVSILCT